MSSILSCSPVLIIWWWRFWFSRSFQKLISYGIKNAGIAELKWNKQVIKKSNSSSRSMEIPLNEAIKKYFSLFANFISLFPLCCCWACSLLRSSVCCSLVGLFAASVWSAKVFSPQKQTAKFTLNLKFLVHNQAKVEWTRNEKQKKSFSPVNSYRAEETFR